MKNILAVSALCVLCAGIGSAQQPAAAGSPQNSSAAHDKEAQNPTLKPEPGGTVVYDWGIPVEVFPDGHSKPLWKGNAATAKSARTWSEDSPEVQVHPAAPQKPAATGTQKPIQQDQSAGGAAQADKQTTNGSGAEATPQKGNEAPAENNPQPSSH